MGYLQLCSLTFWRAQMIRRKRFAELPTQGNYYPLASAGYIEDSRVRMTLTTAQPLGAASMASGQFEVSDTRDRELRGCWSRSFYRHFTEEIGDFLVSTFHR